MKLILVVLEIVPDHNNSLLATFFFFFDFTSIPEQ